MLSTNSQQYRVYKKKRNLGISQEIDIVLKTKDFRGGPLDIWGGGWAITKKKFAHRNNPEKKYRAQQTYWKKKSSKD